MHLLLAALSVVAFPAPQEDPTAVLVVALDAYRVVAVGENHGHLEFHRWLLSALEDPRVVTRVDDIAVEWGNALYQDVVDRYVSGEDVPWDSVTMAWRNTVVSPTAVWDAPPYATFFQRVRRINAALDTSEQYRVILADAPIEWRDVETREDAAPFFDRARAMADNVRRLSLSRGRRSLFVAGGLHVSRRSRVRPNRHDVPTSEITPVAWLNHFHPGSVFSIQSLAREREVDAVPIAAPIDGPAAWPTSAPHLADIDAARVSTLRNRDGSVPDVYGRSPLSDVVDAVILWPLDARTFAEPSADVLQIDSYWDELDRRSRIMRGQPMDPTLRGEPRGSNRPNRSN
ncbi:MAG: hypothetical protein AAF389_02865 [Gemmatimonadota bacterium]